MSAAVVLDARARVLRCECDFGAMHGLLSKLPLTMDLERVVARAVTLVHQMPPAALLLHSEVQDTLAYVRGVFLMCARPVRNAMWRCVGSQALYFQFPLSHQVWPTVTTPVLSEVPPLPPRQTRYAWETALRVDIEWLISCDC